MKLAERWKRALEKAKVATSEQDEAAAQRFAAEVTAKIPAAIDLAIAKGEKYIEVGEFNPDDLHATSQSGGFLGDYYPERNQLSGAALLIYDYCAKEGLHLFVGGDFHLRGSWSPPYEIIIRFKR
ncbi:MAG: hypothetical protein WCV84_02850 [Patescibacteria group bacterium]